MKTFFAELKSRRVYRVALGYLFSSWLVIQVASTVLPTFSVPIWILQSLIFLLALGFPAVLVLAWVFDVKSGTIEWAPEAAGDLPRVSKRRLYLLAAIGLLVSAIVIDGSWMWRPWQRVPASARQMNAPAFPLPEKSIAVLPFANLSTNQENAFFADGVQDEILTELAKIAELKVISRTSVMQYKTDAPRNLREIGAQLGVAHVLEGSVQRADNRVRVTAQLIDARTDAHLWAEHYDKDLADVFAIQSEVAQKIAQQLKAKLSPSEKAAIERSPTADLPAYDLYVRAKALNTATSFNPRAPEDRLQAVALLEQAVARDPEFFLAYCQLASTHDHIYFLGFDHTPARLALADAAVQNALRLQPDSGEAHLALAQHRYRGYLDYDGARAELEIARRTLPNNPLLYELAGYVDRRQGRWEDSLRNLERALELDPRNFFTLQQISLNYFDQRRYREMAAALDRAIALVPTDADTRLTRALADLAWHADTKPMREALDQILAEDPASASKVADSLLFLALCERDRAAATTALTALSGDSFRQDGVKLSRAFGEGLAARTRGDGEAARAAFTAARAQQEQLVQAQVDYAPAICVLGLIDAALGRKEEALQEGRHAMQLLPVTKDAINGARMVEFFAITCAWLGEKDLACEHLAIATSLPGTLSYGQLKLHPFWDALRGDARFEKIVAAMAPREAKP